MIRNFSHALTAAVAACAFLSACDDSTAPETALPPLQKWSFSGKESVYKSGVAVRSRDSGGNPIAGITVWLTDQSVDCSVQADHLPDLNGGWIGVIYPNTSLGKRKVNVNVGYWDLGAGVSGNIISTGAALLSNADTTAEKSVAGSLDFHNDAFDAQDNFGKADVTGSFMVPYCPGI